MAERQERAFGIEAVGEGGRAGSEQGVLPLRHYMPRGGRGGGANLHHLAPECLLL